MNKPHKFIFFGTPAVASATLDALIGHGYVPLAVVTNPDAFVGRKHILTPSPVKTLAESHAIPVMTPEKLDAPAREAIASYGAAYALVIAYGKIFPAALIDSFPLGVLNVHYSLLPKYRGATPLEAALRNGDTETGVTVQKMAVSLDSGDILAQAASPIRPEDTASELRPKLITSGTSLLLEHLPSFEDGTAAYTEQDSAHATYSHKLQKEDGLITLSDDAQKNWNIYRAYTDSIGSYFIEKKTRMKITRAHTASGKFIVDRVIPEGKREMPYRRLP